MLGVFSMNRPKWEEMQINMKIANQLKIEKLNVLIERTRCE